MLIIHTVAVLLGLVALFSYLNYRLLRLPNTFVVLLTAGLVSLVMMAAGKLAWDGLVFQVSQWFSVSTTAVFSLSQFLLGLLLFVAAMQINLQELRQARWVVVVTAVVSIVVSVAVISGLLWVVLQAFSIAIPFEYCILFGLLMSPSDTTGVTGVLRGMRISRLLSATVVGESVLNSLLSISLFTGVLAWIQGSGSTLPFPNVTASLLVHVAGGLLLGATVGWGLAWAIKSLEQQYALVMVVSLAMVLLTHSIASWLGFSTPLALSVLGLFLARHDVLHIGIRELIVTGWNLVSENTVFAVVVVLSLSLLLLPLRIEYFLVVLAVIPVVMIGRYIGAGIPLFMLQKHRSLSPGVIPLMTWGALRVGVAGILALSLPTGLAKDLMLVITYFMMLISIFVQGPIFVRIVDEVR